MLHKASSNLPHLLMKAKAFKWNTGVNTFPSKYKKKPILSWHIKENMSHFLKKSTAYRNEFWYLKSLQNISYNVGGGQARYHLFRLSA